MLIDYPPIVVIRLLGLLKSRGIGIYYSIEEIVLRKPWFTRNTKLPLKLTNHESTRKLTVRSPFSRSKSKEISSCFERARLSTIYRSSLFQLKRRTCRRPRLNTRDVVYAVPYERCVDCVEPLTPNPVRLSVDGIGTVCRQRGQAGVLAGKRLGWYRTQNVLDSWKRSSPGSSRLISRRSRTTFQDCSTKVSDRAT